MSAGAGKFDAVLFDMDGLLLDSERVCLDCLQEVGDAFGLGDMRPLFMTMIGHRSDESRRRLEAGLAGRADPAAVGRDWSARVEARLSGQGAPLKPGAGALLRELRAQGVPCAVATSTQTGAAERLLARAGLAPLVDLVIGGDQVVNAKPDPEIYLRTAAALGVRIENCAIFEDSDPGATAAVRAGATVVQVPDMKAPAAEVRALGHLIAEDLTGGARLIGLL